MEITACVSMPSKIHRLRICWIRVSYRVLYPFTRMMIGVPIHWYQAVKLIYWLKDQRALSVGGKIQNKRSSILPRIRLTLPSIPLHSSNNHSRTIFSPSSLLAQIGKALPWLVRVHDRSRVDLQMLVLNIEGQMMIWKLKIRVYLLTFKPHSVWLICLKLSKPLIPLPLQLLSSLIACSKLQIACKNQKKI